MNQLISSCSGREKTAGLQLPDDHLISKNMPRYLVSKIALQKVLPMAW